MPTTTEAQFDRIYARDRDAIHAYFLGRTSDADLSLDLLQETFLRLWRRIGEVAHLDEEQQRRWIFAVARNLTIDSYRTGATRRATLYAIGRETGESAPESERPDIRAEKAEQLRVLTAAIADLPEPQRLAITMQAAGGMTSADIGTALGEPAGTIRYRISEARKTLMRRLEKETVSS